MENHMNNSMRNWLILATLVIVAILAALWATYTIWLPRSPWEHRWPPFRYIPEDIEFFYTAQAIVSTVNVTLSFFLLYIYVGIYRKTRSEFTIGLIIFSVVFFLNALVSNPLMVWAFGFRPFGLGPFALLPELFTLGALATLLYLSVKY